MAPKKSQHGFIINFSCHSSALSQFLISSLRESDEEWRNWFDKPKITRKIEKEKTGDERNVWASEAKAQADIIHYLRRPFLSCPLSFSFFLISGFLSGAIPFLLINSACREEKKSPWVKTHSKREDNSQETIFLKTKHNYICPGLFFRRSVLGGQSYFFGGFLPRLLS